MSAADHRTSDAPVHVAARAPLRSGSRWLELRTQAIDGAERGVLLAALAFSVGANLASGHPLDIASLASDLLVVLLVIMRRPARIVSAAPLDWILAFGGSLAVLAMRPGGTALVGPAGALALDAPGWIISLAAVLSLGRAFGVVAANRGVQRRGAYRFVRHPMYLGYLFTHTAYLLLNPTALNLAIYLGVCACQLGRIFREEQLLGADPGYRAYCTRVRYRLAPGLF